jgi:hypothetical protein
MGDIWRWPAGSPWYPLSPNISYLWLSLWGKFSRLLLYMYNPETPSRQSNKCLYLLCYMNNSVMAESFWVSISSEQIFAIYSIYDGLVNYPFYGYFRGIVSSWCAVQSHTPIRYAASVQSVILSSLLSYLPLLHKARSTDDKFSFYIFTYWIQLTYFFANLSPPNVENSYIFVFP